MSSANYSDNIPKGLRWTSSKCRKAIERSHDGFVGVSQNKTKTGVDAPTTYKNLSGASRNWESSDPAENRIIYNLEYRIAGLPEDVRASLKLTAQLSSSKLDEIIKDSLSKDNYQTTKHGEYCALVNDIKDVDTSDSLNLAQQFAEQLGTTSTITTVTNTGIIMPQKGPQRTFVNRYLRAESEGLVLDVSTFDKEKFTGAVKRPKPKDYNRENPIFYDAGLALASSNIQTYKDAVEALYGSNGLIAYKSQIAAVEKAIGGDCSSLNITIPQKREPKAKAAKPTMGTPKARVIEKPKQPVKTVGGPSRVTRRK